jgi:hypothetical protein
VAKTPHHPIDARTGRPAPDPDLLAAVVLHTLVASGRDGLTLADVATACERDPAASRDAREVQVALEILLADDLAARRGPLWLPTRAAIRAAELSF